MELLKLFPPQKRRCKTNLVLAIQSTDFWQLVLGAKVGISVTAAEGLGFAIEWMERCVKSGCVIHSVFQVDTKPYTRTKFFIRTGGVLVFIGPGSGHYVFTFWVTTICNFIEISDMLAFGGVRTQAKEHARPFCGSGTANG